MISLSLRKLAPKTHDFIAHFAKDKSFYLWSVCIMVNTAQVARLLFGGIAEGWVIGIYVIFAGLISALNLYEYNIATDSGVGQDVPQERQGGPQEGHVQEPLRHRTGCRIRQDRSLFPR